MASSHDAVRLVDRLQGGVATIKPTRTKHEAAFGSGEGPEGGRCVFRRCSARNRMWCAMGRIPCFMHLPSAPAPSPPPPPARSSCIESNNAPRYLSVPAQSQWAQAPARDPQGTLLYVVRCSLRMYSVLVNLDRLRLVVGLGVVALWLPSSSSLLYRAAMSTVKCEIGL